MNGQQLKALRLNFKYTQAQLADEIGVSVSQISKMETGVNKIKGPILKLLENIQRQKTTDAI